MEFTSYDCDLRNYLLEGKVKALAKTEAAVYHDCQIGKHTSCWYNSISKHLVGNYENWLYAEPVKDWCIGSFKNALDYIKLLDNMGLLRDVKEGLSNDWEVVKKWLRVDLTKTEYNRLDLPMRTPEQLPPASSRGR